ncbi:MAG: PQQ-binding-like beta-propeller repeat protein [bacterium]
MLKRRNQVTEESDVAVAQTDEPTQQKSLRLWPGVVAAVLLCLVRFGLPVVKPEATGSAILWGLAGVLAILLWWVFLSRAPWLERLGAVVLMIVALIATSRIAHESIATGGQGRFFFILTIPVLSLALVAGAAVSRRLSAGPRRATMVAAILLGCGVMTLLRSEGVTGDYASQLAWRWTKTSEERLLAQTGKEPIARSSAPSATETPEEQLGSQAHVTPAAPATTKTPEKRLTAQAGDEPAALATAQTPAETSVDWPGFRGPNRDGILRGVRINTDWAASPPVELWRRPIGPGWSSFAVRGKLLYTQEQRGDDEVVACYNLTTGEPVWTHRDSVRFWESNAGAGPRATPTLSNGRAYTFGATGILNALDAVNGAVVWTRHAASDAKKKIPIWGFAGSPLVVDDVVIAAAAGALIAFDLATGNPRWFGPDSGWGYSSPQLMTIDGVRQLLLLNGSGAISVSPVDGTLLWEHRWPGDGIVQPALTADGDVLIGTGSGLGTDAGIGVRCIAVTHGAGGWTAAERWTSIGLKPYFNDFVVHEGHAFGFDGSILACIDLQDGKRKWKGGRYGHGQLILLADEDLLLVLSEQGDLALIAAVPDKFTELAQFPAIKGKTWNHPVLVDDVLLVRNGQEMVAFRLPRMHS